MKKTHKALFLLTLIASSFSNSLRAENQFGQSFWDGVGIAAAAIAVGVGAAKLASWCLTETNLQLISRAEGEYSKALGYREVIGIYEDRHYNGTSSYDAATESVLYTISVRLSDKRVSLVSYLKDLVHSEGKLRSTFFTLKERINDLNRKYLDHDELMQVRAMKDIASRIDTFLIRLTPFARYVDSHQSYFGIYECEARLLGYYDAELKIAQHGMYAHIIMYDLQQAIVWRHSRSKYPFTEFITKLGSDLSTLKSYIRSISSRYPERHGYAQALYDQLQWIQHAASADDRYRQELYQAEQERLERLRLEALREQARLEQQQLSAARHHNNLLRQSNDLKRQELSENKRDCWCDDPGVMVIVPI